MSYDPFSAAPAQPAPPVLSATSSPFGVSSPAYDPFSPSRLSGPPPAASALFASPPSLAAQPARLFPASPFDPSLPPVAKSAEVGPNVLDARQFDPFQVVNL